MLRNLIIHLALLLVFIFLQAFMFDNMKLSSLQIYPFVYVAIILMLPFETPKWLLLLTGFFSGLLLDIFNDTLGVNTAAATLLAYVRPFTLSVLSPYDGYENGTLPRVGYYGTPWYLKYISMNVFVFAAAFYLLVSFSFNYFASDLLKIFFGSIYTIVIILLIQFAFFLK